MPEFWTDTNVFIQAKDGPYAFDIAPGFWSLLDEMTAEGRIASSSLVYDELLDIKDKGELTELAEWAKSRKNTGLFIQPDWGTQVEFRRVSEYVQETYAQNQNQMRQFLAKADPWLIAHAIAGGGKVVTMEVRVPANSQKVKIPNVCDAFGVETLNTYQMLRELGASFK